MSSAPNEIQATTTLREFKEYKVGDQVIVRCNRNKWLFGTIEEENERGIIVWVHDSQDGVSQKVRVPFVLVPTHMRKSTDLGQTSYLPDHCIRPVEVSSPQREGPRYWLPLVRPVHLAHRHVYCMAEGEITNPTVQTCKICHQPVDEDNWYFPWDCEHVCHLTCVRYGFKKGLTTHCPSCHGEDAESSKNAHATYFCQSCGHVGSAFCPTCKTTNWSSPLTSTPISGAAETFTRSELTKYSDPTLVDLPSSSDSVTNGLGPIHEGGEEEETIAPGLLSPEHSPAVNESKTSLGPSPLKPLRNLFPSSSSNPNSLENSFAMLRFNFSESEMNAGGSGSGMDSGPWITVVENGCNARSTGKYAKKQQLAEEHEKRLFGKETIQ